MTRPDHESGSWTPPAMLVQCAPENGDRFAYAPWHRDPRRGAGHNLRPFAIAAVSSVMAWMMILVMVGVI